MKEPTSTSSDIKIIPTIFRKQKNKFYELNAASLTKKLKETTKNPKPGDYLFGVQTNGDEEQLVIAYYKRPFAAKYGIPGSFYTGEKPKLQIETKTLSLADLRTRFDNDPEKVRQGLVEVVHIDYDLTITLIHAFFNAWVISKLKEKFPEKYKEFIKKNIRFPKQLKQAFEALLAKLNIHLTIASNNTDKELIKETLLCILESKYLPDRFSCIGCKQTSKVIIMEENIKEIIKNKGVIAVVNNTLVDDSYRNRLSATYAGAEIIEVTPSEYSKSIQTGHDKWHSDSSSETSGTEEEEDDDDDSYSSDVTDSDEEQEDNYDDDPSDEDSDSDEELENNYDDDPSDTESEEEEDNYSNRLDNNSHLIEIIEKYQLRLDAKHEEISSEEIEALHEILKIVAPELKGSPSKLKEKHPKIFTSFSSKLSLPLTFLSPPKTSSQSPTTPSPSSTSSSSTPSSPI